MKTKQTATGRILPLLLAAVILFAAAAPALAFAGPLDDPASEVSVRNAVTLGALPCIGEARVAVFYVTFPGGAENWLLDKAGVEKMFFDETLKNNTDPALTLSGADSLRSFYWRSSYGRLDITGDVFEYTMQNDAAAYSYAEIAMQEIVSYFADRIDWSQYDKNDDGYVDGVYLIARTRHAWGGPNFVGGFPYDFACGKKLCQYAFIDSCWLSTVAHETCHMFGPADMYAGVSLNPAGTASESIMDGGFGDLPSPTKFVLGWLDQATLVTGTGTETYTLPSYSRQGSALIIPPLGNAENLNWFFVEYVTPEGNNRQNGVRVWRTQMVLDGHYNIAGADSFCSAFPNSPYEYLEAVHPEGVTDYFLQPGDSLTPYGNPSTSYALSFNCLGGLKLIDEAGFSGISLTVDAADGAAASLSVGIGSEPDPSVTAAARLITYAGADGSYPFVTDSAKRLVAAVKSGAELKTGDASLVCAATGQTLPLRGVKDPDGSLLFYLDNADLDALDPAASYTVDLQGIRTYYGGALEVAGADAPIVFGNCAKPMYATEVKYAFDGRIDRDADDPDLLRLPDGAFVTFLQDVQTGDLWLYRTEDKTFAQTGKKLTSDYRTYFSEGRTPMLLGFWRLATGELAVVLTDDYTYYIAAYDENGTLLAENAAYRPIGRYCVSSCNTLPLIVSDEILTVVMEDGLPVFRAYEGARGTFSYGGKYEYVRKSALCGDDLFCICSHGLFCFRNGSPVLLDAFADPESYGNDVFGPFIHDGEVWFLTVRDGLYASVFDAQTLEKLDEIMLSGDLNLNFIIDADLRFDGARLALSVEAVPADNRVSYASTLLLIFNEDRSLAYYYRYGDASYRFVAAPAYIGNDRFLMAEKYSLFVVSPEENQPHFFGEWIAEVPATCRASGERGHYQCCICGKYFDADGSEIADLTIAKGGHAYGEWIAEVPATCTESGAKGHYHCSVCGKDFDAARIETADLMIPAKGHDYREASRTESTCVRAGSVTYVCANDPAHTCTGSLPLSDRHSDNNGDGRCDLCSKDLGTAPAPGGAGDCPYCHGAHTGFFGSIVGFFHRIAYFFAHLFGRM